MLSPKHSRVASRLILLLCRRPDGSARVAGMVTPVPTRRWFESTQLYQITKINQ
jgi:hypothetical protein